MAIATELESAVGTFLSSFVSSKSAALTGMLGPILLVGLTIYILLMGFAVMRGEAQDPLGTLTAKLLKFAFICGLALSAGEYQTYVVGGIEGVQGVLSAAVGGASTVGGVIDAAQEPYEKLVDALTSAAMSDFVPKFGLLLAGLIVFLSQVVLFPVALGMYLLAKIGLTLVLAMGPAFIACALFPATQRFTESWLGTALSLTLASVLISACVGFTSSFAGAFANHILSGLGSLAVMRDCLALALISVAQAILLLNVNSLASALGGGATIGGVGRDIVRWLQHRQPSTPRAAAAGGSLSASQAAGASGAAQSGPSPANSQRPGGALYRSRTLKSINRATRRAA